MSNTRREDKGSEKMIKDTRCAYMIMSRLQSPTDAKALEDLSVLSFEALERAMWLLQKQKNTVDEMRGQHDEVMKQVLQVQLVMQELLKSRQRG